MKTKLIKVVLFLTICLFAVAVYGQQTSNSSPPSPAPLFKLIPTAITGEQQYLYVMTGGKVLQYENAEMTLLRSVDLPQPSVPKDVQPPPQPMDSGQLLPPPPVPHGLWAGNGSLYALAGPFIYVYSIPDLTFQKTIELPKPDLPQAGK